MICIYTKTVTTAKNNYCDTTCTIQDTHDLVQSSCKSYRYVKPPYLLAMEVERTLRMSQLGISCWSLVATVALIAWYAALA